MNEKSYAYLLTGGSGHELLMTDGYKFAMAQAGFPLREETFYLSCRKGGPFYMPFDFGEVVQALAAPPPSRDWRWLDRYEYGLTQAMLSATNQPVHTWAAPKGSWVGNGEPIVTVTGPSFKVSCLEPLVIMFRFAIQVATAAVRDNVTNFRASCESEAAIIEMVLAAVGKTGSILMDSKKYIEAVRRNVEAIKTSLDGDLSRAFEVGMRAASCLDQHRIALAICQQAGLSKTSNVFLALEFNMTPVGTTGHEHQQRWMNDRDAFRAMRDMRVSPPSYLFDTYDVRRGQEHAIATMLEDPDKKCSVRFDSGDQDQQLRYFLDAEKYQGVRPTYIFEDSYSAEKTARNERLCDSMGLEKSRRFYGYGGFIVSPESGAQFCRDDVSAVYKLSQTGITPVMKSCGEKSSIPGRPVIRVSDHTGGHVIAQMSEFLPGYHDLNENDSRSNLRIYNSTDTISAINSCNYRNSK